LTYISFVLLPPSHVPVHHQNTHTLHNHYNECSPHPPTQAVTSNINITSNNNIKFYFILTNTLTYIIDIDKLILLKYPSITTTYMESIKESGNYLDDILIIIVNNLCVKEKVKLFKKFISEGVYFSPECLRSVYNNNTNSIISDTNNNNNNSDEDIIINTSNNNKYNNNTNSIISDEDIIINTSNNNNTNNNKDIKLISLKDYIIKIQKIENIEKLVIIYKSNNNNNSNNNINNNNIIPLIEIKYFLYLSTDPKVFNYLMKESIVFKWNFICLLCLFCKFYNINSISNLPTFLL
ncbi:hypothetical protein CDIK_4075, partial [Cucumispora dikerogammari]